MASPQANAAPARGPASPLSEFWFYFTKNRGATAGLVIIGFLVLVAIFANLIAPFDPDQQFRDNLLQPPFWQEGGAWPFILGTDDIGRDMLSRLIYGARLSMMIGFVCVAIALSCGVVIGMMAGYYRGAVDSFIMRLMDIILALPSLLLAIVIVAVLGPGLINTIFAVALVTLPHYVRLMRASVISEAGRDYVIAARMVGAGTFRVMFQTILPNCLAPLIVQATLGFSTAILDAAALGFLGLGAQPPTSEWGTMLAGALQYLQLAWWVVTFPGLAILITVLAFNLMGDGLRDALDPKLKRS